MTQKNINKKDFIQTAMKLPDLGWNSFFEEAFLQWKDSGLNPGRVISRSGPLYEVLWEHGNGNAPVSGHFSYIAAGAADYPAVGDWVLLRGESESPVIERVLSRKTFFARRASGRSSDEQVSEGLIEHARYENYIGLRKEVEALEMLRSEKGRSEKKSGKRGYQS